MSNTRTPVRKQDRQTVFLFAKHLDGGTGVFVEQMKSFRIGGRPVHAMVFALEKPQFRAASSSKAPVLYFSNKQLLPYSYILNLKAIINTLRELFWLKKHMSQYRPAVVISVDNHCNVLVGLCKMFFYQTKTVLTIHNNISAVTFAKLPARGRKIFQRVCRFLFHKADAIVCVSKGVAVDAKQFFSLTKLPHVIHVGVNVQNIQQLAHHPVKPEYTDIFRSKKTKIITIGRFAPQKDFITLIDAFALLFKTNKNMGLYIMGDGQEKEKIMNHVRSYNLEKHIHLLGWEQNVYPYIKACDIFVLSSNYEGFPYVLLEAAALGKPIVATDTPYGPKELLGDNTYGLVVPMKSPEKLSNALALLLKKKEYNYYRSQISNRVGRFSEAIMLKQYQTLIESLA